MTSYSRYRKYPSPSSERERGEGGPDSEEFARAVAKDLDVLDAVYLALQVGNSITMTVSADQVAALLANNENLVFFNTVEAKTGTINGSTTFFVPRGGDGWYNLNLIVHTVASGTVTANVRHRVIIRRTGQLYGNSTTLEDRTHESYQATGSEVYMHVEGVMHLRYGDSIEARYFHLNASDMTLRAAGTRFCATLIAAG